MRSTAASLPSPALSTRHGPIQERRTANRRLSTLPRSRLHEHLDLGNASPVYAASRATRAGVAGGDPSRAGARLWAATSARLHLRQASPQLRGRSHQRLSARLTLHERRRPGTSDVMRSMTKVPFRNVESLARLRARSSSPRPNKPPVGVTSGYVTPCGRRAGSSGRNQLDQTGWIASARRRDSQATTSATAR